MSNSTTGAVCPSGTDLRKAALADVGKCVCNDRQNTYGDAEDNFSNIAAVSTIALGRKLKEPLDALDMSLIMLAVKLCRCASSPRHRDNLIDAAGYAVCGVGIIDRETLNKGGA